MPNLFRNVSTIEEWEEFLYEGVEYRAVEKTRSYGDGSYRIQVQNLETNAIIFLEFDEGQNNPKVEVTGRYVPEIPELEGGAGPDHGTPVEAFLDIVFSKTSGPGQLPVMQFIEVEFPAGVGRKVGKWVLPTPDDPYYRLRITAKDIP
jgi:hypothetical protein